MGTPLRCTAIRSTWPTRNSKYLVQHPGRVFTRAQLLQEVWGYDYYGGTRTVDVHIRRLRAKLGGEYEHLIGTVRNVGYRFDPPEDEQQDGEARAQASAGAHGLSGLDAAATNANANAPQPAAPGADANGQS